MLYHAFAASCSSTPTFSTASMNSAELPSMIGISGPFNSIKRLSTPKPTKAARMCSTVLTLASPTCKVVPRLVSVTKSQSALIKGWFGKSTL